ncbi:hypothetical protein GCM10023107_64730 [Actinoplanes octamycinicus]|nr:hypothetical protein Aoc01nite_15260 [Actinoplanes octamycinicus]
MPYADQAEKGKADIHARSGDSARPQFSRATLTTDAPSDGPGRANIGSDSKIGAAVSVDDDISG